MIKEHEKNIGNNIKKYIKRAVIFCQVDIYVCIECVYMKNEIWYEENFCVYWEYSLPCLICCCLFLFRSQFMSVSYDKIFASKEEENYWKGKKEELMWTEGVSIRCWVLAWGMIFLKKEALKYFRDFFLSKISK